MDSYSLLTDKMTPKCWGLIVNTQGEQLPESLSFWIEHILDHSLENEYFNKTMLPKLYVNSNFGHPFYFFLHDQKNSQENHLENLVHIIDSYATSHYEKKIIYYLTFDSKESIDELNKQFPHYQNIEVKRLYFNSNTQELL